MTYGHLLAFALIIIILYYFARIGENAYVLKFKRPLYIHFYVLKKRLTKEQLGVLETQFEFYEALKPLHRRFFEHRLFKFLKDKDFYGREDLLVTEEMKVLLGATAVMLTFGMRNFYLGILEKIIIYPEAYYSNITQVYHKGEFNPRLKALVISWKDFKEGFNNSTDNINLGIHEFTHILQLNCKRFRDVSASIFSDGYVEIETMLKDENYRSNLMKSDYFRDYAFSNKYEFLAVLIENFVESPKEFKLNFPQLYGKVRQMLNYDYTGY